MNADNRIIGNLDSCLVACYRSNKTGLGQFTSVLISDVQGYMYFIRSKCHRL